MKYLISTTEQYRVDTVDEVETLHEEMKNDNKYSLTNFTYKYETKKQKGEVVDDWYTVTAKKEFNDKKEPISTIDISYEVIF